MQRLIQRWMRRWGWNWLEGLHSEASVATPIIAAETRMGAVKVWNADRPTGRLVMVAFLMREGWNSWTRKWN